MEIPSYFHKNIIYENPPNVKYGAEAIVFKGTLPFVQGDLAIKQWSDWFCEKDEKRRIRREVALLMENPHDNIIKFLGILVNEESEWIGYVMPYMAMGSLDEIIHNKNNKKYDDIYTSEQIKRWIVKICRGLSYLHSKSIIHRDIKPSNILLAESYDEIKLSDFGIARSLENETHSLTTGRGTEFYMAPEIIKGDTYTLSADIYSLSITIWEILNRSIPYDHIKYPSLFVLYQMTCEGVRPKLKNDLSKRGFSFLASCWDDDASKRPKIDEILEFCERPRFSSLRRLVEKSNGNVDAQSPIENSSEKQTILLVGGADGKNKDSLMMLENDGQNWKELNIKLPYAIENHGAQFLNNNLYIFGGQVMSGKAINCTYKLSKSLQWEKVADMNQTRFFISNSNVILNNQIWVCGGSNGKETLKSVDIYDPEVNKWKYSKDMNECRWGAAATVVNGKIFCSGGFMNNSVECFDPSSYVWTHICIMPQKIYGHGAVEIDGNLIIMGGDTAFGRFENVWALDTTDRDTEWIGKPSMSRSRSHFSIAKIDNKIFVCGQGRSVEIFDGEVWRNGPNMPTYREHASAVVISMEFARYLN